MKGIKTNEERGKDKTCTESKGGQVRTSKVLQSCPPASGRSKMSHDKGKQHRVNERAEGKEELSPSPPSVNCDRKEI